MRKVSLLFPFVAAILLSACASRVVGDRYDLNAPQLKPDPYQKDNWIWDRPKAFGPVPMALEKKAQESCSQLNTQQKTYKAIGYHPRALNSQGVAISGGGYFCIENK